MNNNELINSFYEVINSYYPSAQISNPRMSNNPNRKEVLVSKRKKRWMKIDDKPKVLHISMDHYRGALTEEDVKQIGMHLEEKNKYKLDYLSEGNYDAVHFSFCKDIPYNFNNEYFLQFLEKQFNAYMKLL